MRSRLGGPQSPYRRLVSQPAVTSITRYYRQTRDLACLQRLLGHADPKTTMVYVDDTPADRERLMLLASDEPTTLDVDRAA